MHGGTSPTHSWRGARPGAVDCLLFLAPGGRIVAAISGVHDHPEAALDHPASVKRHWAVFALHARIGHYFFQSCVASRLGRPLDPGKAHLFPTLEFFRHSLFSSRRITRSPLLIAADVFLCFGLDVVHDVAIVQIGAFRGLVAVDTGRNDAPRVVVILDIGVGGFL